MQIRSIWISKYKNLNNFSLELNKDHFLDLFVGRNGSGKSNLLEAIVHIFNYLYAPDTSPKIFDFEISYQIGTEEGYKLFTIRCEDARIQSKVQFLYQENNEIRDGGAVVKPGKNLASFVILPDNLFIYYSGHNEQLKRIVERNLNSFRRRIKGPTFFESPKFVQIGPEYKDILIALTIFQHPENRARQYIWDRVGIKNAPDRILVRLYCPYYAQGKSKYRIEEFDTSTHFWHLTGGAREFIDRLLKCIPEAYQHSEIFDTTVTPNAYFLNLDRTLLQQEFSDSSPIEMFRMFDNLKTLGMAPMVNIAADFEDGRSTREMNFSDGQFQSIYVYALAEMLKETGGNYITLLDEPDTFLHPEWQVNFVEQVNEILHDGTENNHILMTSHSAATVSKCAQKQINSFEVKDHQVTCAPKSKKDIIKLLSNNAIQYSEAESSLLIDNVVRNSNRPILFVEGITDVHILNVAYEKLFPDEDIPILIQDAFDRGFIKILLSRNEFYQRYPNKYFYGLFDFDDAYGDWRDLGGDYIEEEIEKGLCRKLENKNAYAFMLPIPDNEIKSQVHNENSPLDRIVGQPHFTIEHVFWDYVNKQGFKKNKKNIWQFSNKANKKLEFAVNIVANLPAEAFEPFRPIFDRIKQITDDTKNQAEEAA